MKMTKCLVNKAERVVLILILRHLMENKTKLQACNRTL